MRGKALDNSERFFYDCGKISFAVLVIGAIAREPVERVDLLWGMVLTLIFFIGGVTINQFERE